MPLYSYCYKKWVIDSSWGSVTDSRVKNSFEALQNSPWAAMHDTKKKRELACVSETTQLEPRRTKTDLSRIIFAGSKDKSFSHMVLEFSYLRFLTG